MKPTTRIIVNTVATYGRSIFSLFLHLFSARWVLAALGQTDFGLYGVVGSLILLINILNGGMSIGVARFYAFSIGEGHHRTSGKTLTIRPRRPQIGQETPVLVRLDQHVQSASAPESGSSFFDCGSAALGSPW